MLKIIDSDEEFKFVRTPNLIHGICALIEAPNSDSKFCSDILKIIFSCSNSEKENIIVEEKDVMIISKLLDRYTGDENIYQACCNSFVYIASLNLIEYDILSLIIDIIKANKENEDVCIVCCEIIGEIDQEFNNLQEVVKVITNTIKTHPNNSSVYKNGCKAIERIIDLKSIPSKELFLEHGAIELITEILKDNNCEESMYGFFCRVVDSISSEYLKGQDFIFKNGIIDLVIEVLKRDFINPESCEAGCCFLSNITEGNTSFQKAVCEKGGLSTLLKVFKDYMKQTNIDLLKVCCSAIWNSLSSQESHSKYCTPEVLNEIETFYYNNNDIEKLKHLLLSVKRENNPKVLDAVSRGACTKEAFPLCESDCISVNGYYCPSCFVQQKAFRCFTCNKDIIVFYCETCWKRDHQGHECEEFFQPIRCGTNLDCEEKEGEENENECGNNGDEDYKTFDN